MEKVTSWTLLITSIDTMVYWHTNVWIKSYIHLQQDSRQTDGLENKIIRERKVLPVPRYAAEARRPASCGRTNCQINKARSEVYELISTIYPYFGTNALVYNSICRTPYFSRRCSCTSKLRRRWVSIRRQRGDLRIAAQSRAIGDSTTPTLLSRLMSAGDLLYLLPSVAASPPAPLSLMVD